MTDNSENTKPGKNRKKKIEIPITVLVVLFDKFFPLDPSSLAVCTASRSTPTPTHPELLPHGRPFGFVQFPVAVLIKPFQHLRSAIGPIASGLPLFR